MSSRFGDRSWEMEGNVLDAEKKNTSDQGYNASTFIKKYINNDMPVHTR